MTPEALVLHFVDDLDSKLNQLDRIRREGPGVQWSRGLGRHVWFAAREEVVEERVTVGAPEAAEGGAEAGETVVEEAAGDEPADGEDALDEAAAAEVASHVRPADPGAPSFDEWQPPPVRPRGLID